jgi:hypothetical protein
MHNKFKAEQETHHEAVKMAYNSKMEDNQRPKLIQAYDALRSTCSSA